ncbi:MAG: GGDEF domain-containing protein [Burkholderiales bacterium]|nr:GGDEF domain-containing protein [Burkholderiales bacterium]
MCIALLASVALTATLAQAASTAIVDVDESSSELQLTPRLQIFEDLQGRLKLEDLLAKQSAWTEHHANALNLGFSKSTWWARVALRNVTGKTLVRILDSGTALEDFLDFYVVRKGDIIDQRVITGDRRPFNTRPVLTRVPSLQIQLAPGEQVDIYIRLATHDGLHETVNLILWQQPAYATHTQTETLAFGLYYGALLTVLLYNLFLYASTRQRAIGAYVAYVSAFLLWSFTFRGYSFQYLWPGSPVFNNQLLPIAAAACYCMFGIFVMEYLETSRNLPGWLHRTLLGSTWGNVLFITPALFNVYGMSFAASIPVGVTLMVASLTAGFMLIKRGSRPARYFMIAFTLLALGVMLYYAQLVGALPSNVITENFLQIGSALEVLLLAFGLADQMNTLKSDKLRAERKALAVQTVLNDELEALVQQRTAALEAASQRLADMAITDELTSAYNRRHFNTTFDAEMARHSRHRLPIAFCILDIDNFKLYNDTYGHQAGDTVLQQVSSAMRSRLRRSGDIFFRLGGEEFGILLSVEEPLGKAQPFVESLRDEIEAMGLLHEGNPYGVVTASFGLVLLTRDAEEIGGHDVYALADKLLYQAKHAGRNCVMVQSL